MKQIISTQEAPAAIGAYSQAVIANGMLFASGQLGIDPATGEFAGADFRSQAEQAVKNVAAILKAANTDASHVIKTTVFLTDMANFAVLNEVYSTLFAAPFPARSAVAVAALPKGGLVEIEVIEWGSSRLSMEKLSDRRGYSHCRQMYAALLEQSRHRNTANTKKSGWFRR